MATSTRKKMERLVARKPDISGVEIAEKIGISRQRVSVLARDMGIRLKSSTQARAEKRDCSICGKPLKWPGTITHARCHLVQVRCAGCGVHFRRSRRDRARSRRQYHSRECFVEARRRRAARKTA